MSSAHHTADEGRCGPVTITLDTERGRAEVSGPGIPTARLLRTDGDRADRRPADDSPADGVTPIGTRSVRAEDVIKLAKSAAGMADDEVRSFHGWYRHITLVQLTAAFLAVQSAADERADIAGTPAD
jgi:hypothetical protein